MLLFMLMLMHPMATISVLWDRIVLGFAESMGMIEKDE